MSSYGYIFYTLYLGGNFTKSMNNDDWYLLDWKWTIPYTIYPSILHWNLRWSWRIVSEYGVSKMKGNQIICSQEELNLDGIRRTVWLGYLPIFAHDELLARSAGEWQDAPLIHNTGKGKSGKSQSLAPRILSRCRWAGNYHVFKVIYWKSSHCRVRLCRLVSTCTAAGRAQSSRDPMPKNYRSIILFFQLAALPILPATSGCPLLVDHVWMTAQS